MIVSIVSAFISTIGFSIVFHIQKKHLLICGTVGALGWAIYLLLERMGASTVLASFVAALVVTQASYFLSKRRKTPITVFLIAGIIPLVPGLGLYRTMFAILESNYSSAIEYATLTFEIAGVIAGAIVIISLLPLLWRKPRR
ncbi:threonine/serine exporter family protein [Cellulosilyticum sp. ST5]|uniref:threonine/serine exporter family protein n=1 Tax=unclassified Cellulosilyticum TaxID=2643091 RepID=UPI000F8DA311|nr:threonine/serine exporter family protein [Cellulosilyticum sp. WCF-2]QEH68499.1 threonine/serine exporter [Cellulosilyticum sp. WCF-2]